MVSWLHQQGGGWDSGPLASHLERLARRGELAGAWQLALDMYSRLAMHDKHCQMLLAKVSAAPPHDHSFNCMVLLECCYLQLSEHPTNPAEVPCMGAPTRTIVQQLTVH